MSRIFYPLVVVIALVGIGWFGYHWQRGSDPTAAIQTVIAGGEAERTDGAAGKNATAQASKKNPQAGGRPKRGPVGVTVAAVMRGEIEQRVDVVGSLLAAQSILVRPEIDGRISEIGIVDGANVAMGDMMFRLDSDVVDAQMAQAQAELALARSNLRRTRNLASQSFVSRRSRDEAQANVNVLFARMQVVKARQSRTVIKAAFAGRVGLVAVSSGDYVKAGATLVRLDDLARLKLDLKVPEQLLSQVQSGQMIRLRVDAFPERAFTARVRTIDSSVDPTGRSVLVRGLLDNAEGLLLPGMFARASLVLARRDDALLVPEASVIPGQTGPSVFRVVEGRALRTAVKTGVRQDGQVEVLSGLNEGDSVVESGHIKLRGREAAVRVLPPKSASR